MILWRSGGKGWLSELNNQWIKDKAVYRTAPATPGLLIMDYLMKSRPASAATTPVQDSSKKEKRYQSYYTQFICEKGKSHDLHYP